MTNNLLKVAALPMGGGCMSALPAEKNEHRDQTLQTILRELPSYEEMSSAELGRRYLAACLGVEPIDLGPIGGTGC